MKSTRRSLHPYGGARQRKESTWGSHVIDFCRCVHFPPGWGRGGGDSINTDRKIYSVCLERKKKELRLTVLDERLEKPRSWGSSIDYCCKIERKRERAPNSFFSEVVKYT